MADDDEAKERRRAERVPVNAEFGAMPSMVYVSDLSEHGVFVHTFRFVALGTKVQVRFTVLLDDPVLISAHGRVVRHQQQPAGVGIEFARLDPETVLRIGDIVTRQRPRDLLVPAGSRGPAPAPVAGDTRVVRPPVHPPADTKVVTAPPAPAEAEAFDAHQTLVKLQAIDLEILDDDDEFDQDPGGSGPRSPR